MTALHCLIWFGLVAFAICCAGFAVRCGWLLYRDWRHGGTGSDYDPELDLPRAMYAIGGLAFSLVAGTVAVVIATDWRPCV